MNNFEKMTDTRKVETAGRCVNSTLAHASLVDGAVFLLRNGVLETSLRLRTLCVTLWALLPPLLAPPLHTRLRLPHCAVRRPRPPGPARLDALTSLRDFEIRLQMRRTASVLVTAACLPRTCADVGSSGAVFLATFRRGVPLMISTAAAASLVAVRPLAARIVSAVHIRVLIAAVHVRV